VVRAGGRDRLRLRPRDRQRDDNRAVLADTRLDRGDDHRSAGRARAPRIGHADERRADRHDADRYGDHNDDTPGTTVNRGSTLARNFDAGTYYLAVSNFNTATNLSQANPDEGTQTGNVMDFANVIANSSTTTTPQSVSLLVTYASGPRPVPLTRTAANEVLFVRMIVQAPASCSPADVADTDGQQGGDGTIDNGDFTLFFTAFFAPLGDPQRALADIADTDAVPGADGNVDNGDFTLFFDAFFAGCP
jgi:hypothetical protein